MNVDECVLSDHPFLLKALDWLVLCQKKSEIFMYKHKAIKTEKTNSASISGGDVSSDSSEPRWKNKREKKRHNLLQSREPKRILKHNLKVYIFLSVSRSIHKSMQWIGSPCALLLISAVRKRRWSRRETPGKRWMKTGTNRLGNTRFHRRAAALCELMLCSEMKSSEGFYSLEIMSERRGGADGFAR